MIYSNSLQGIALASTAFAKICACPLFLSLFIIMYSILIAAKVDCPCMPSMSFKHK